MSDAITCSERRHHGFGMVLAMGLFLASETVQAHKLGIFAFADGARIEGRVYFIGGGRAGARITIENVEGRILAQPGTNAEGSFFHVAEAAVDHVIIADTGEGHRAQWRISSAELAAGFPGESVPFSGTMKDSTSAEEVAQPGLEKSPVVVDAELRSMIEGAVSRQVRPLREELILIRETLRFKDILGGLGYLFGLAGLALWWNQRHPKGGE